MKQIVHIVFHNIANCKLKAIMIVVLMSFSMFTSLVSYSFKQSIEDQVEITTEELDTNAKIKVMSKNSDNVIPLSTIDYMEQMDGVKSVIPQYNFGGLLEKEMGVPIYSVTLNGFDFENNLFMGAEDYRNQNVSGILLPDLTVTMGEEIVLKELIGQEVLFTYEYVSDKNILSRTITCKVIGVYEAKGTFDENPVYMSMDLFTEVLNDYAVNISGVSSATVYLESADCTEKVAEDLNNLGVEVFYESTVEDYMASLEGIVTLSIVVVVVILIFAIIIIIQTLLANLRKRYATIGVMKAYGYSTASICFLVWFEIFIYCIMSVIITLLLSLIGQGKIQEFFGVFMAGVSFTLNPNSILILLGIGVIVSGISAIIPCRNLVRLNPIDVLKSN